jgi:hypothetical protein
LSNEILLSSIRTLLRHGEKLGFGIFTVREPISGPETWVRVAQVLIGVYESPRAHHDGLDPISAASRCVETAAWRHAPVTAS